MVGCQEVAAHFGNGLDEVPTGGMVVCRISPGVVCASLGVNLIRVLAYSRGRCFVTMLLAGLSGLATTVEVIFV